MQSIQIERCAPSGFFFLLTVLFTALFIWPLNLMGYDLVTAFATVAACINNMGLGYGETAAGFWHAELMRRNG